MESELFHHLWSRGRLCEAMLASLLTRRAVLVCQPVQLYTGMSREAVGRVAVRGAAWKRLASDQARTVRAVPMEGVGSRFSGELEFTVNHRHTLILSDIERRMSLKLVIKTRDILAFHSYTYT